MNPKAIWLCLFLASETEAFSSQPNNLIAPSTKLNLALENEFQVGRREALSFVALATTNLLLAPALAADNEYTGNGFAFRFVPPPGMEPGAKPVKTHLYEINWKSETTPRYTFGVTVDPVRIQSLKEVSATVLWDCCPRMCLILS